MTEISVIVPFFNSQNFLKCCIKSVLRQSFKSYELILIDDGSTDSSSLIAKSFEKHKSVKIFTTENRGASCARNLGISKASGNFIMFLDSDDLIHENVLYELYRAIKKMNVEIAGCNKTRFYEQPNFNFESLSFKKVSDLEFVKQSLSICGKLYSKRLFEESEVRFPENNCAEDIAYLPHLAELSKSIAYTKSIGYGYRKVDQGSVTSSQKVIYDRIKSINILSENIKDPKLFSWVSVRCINSNFISLALNKNKNLQEKKQVLTKILYGKDFRVALKKIKEKMKIVFLKEFNKGLVKYAFVIYLGANVSKNIIYHSYLKKIKTQTHD